MKKVEERKLWMATLAKAPLSDLEARVQALGVLPQYSFLRPPEIGLTMLRGRAGGTGQVFNLGEMTITRCVVQIENQQENSSVTGFGYVAGRSLRHAELAALCDALMQLPDWCNRVQVEVIESIQTILDQQKEAQKRQTAATKVNFFTLIRGEG